MTQLTIQQAFDLALVHHEAGRLREAEQLYQQILIAHPQHADVLHNLGVIARQGGQSSAAIDYFRRSIAIWPKNPDVYNNLGIVLLERGELDEAIDSFRKAVAINPDYGQAKRNLANALQSKAAVYHGQGNSFREQGQLNQAISAYRQAIALRSDYAEVLSNLGVTLQDIGQLDEAITIFHQAILLRPAYPDVYNNLCIALIEKGQLDEAIAAGQKALSLNSNMPETHSNLGDALRGRGDLDEAIAAYRQAIASRPGFSEAHSSLVYTLNFHPHYEANAIAEEHRLWNREYAKSLESLIQPHRNDRTADRRLRIGYVSPDFRGHAVSCFVLPLLAAHDRSQFEIFCYAQVSVPDAITQRIQATTDVYRNIVGRSDNEVAKMIRDDQVDILIDLVGHTAGNRLLMFAQKPAPVQVTYLGYPATTGLDAIDYRLTDIFADPPGMTDSFHSEKLIRLGRCAWCYQPLQPPPPVSEFPALHNKYITFGSFNNFAKVNPPVLKRWAEILLAVPGSRLLLKARSLRCKSVKQKVIQVMEETGVSPDRLDLRGWVSAGDHLSVYGQVDIALDTFPYNGTTTTCESILMGVPVVTLAGQSHVARVGASLLASMGLSEFVGDAPDQYVRIAIELANDLPRLTALRSTLRQRMEQSSLMAGPGFTRDVEAAYRQMWHRWTNSQAVHSSA